jgi:hypothetical protein
VAPLSRAIAAETRSRDTLSGENLGKTMIGFFKLLNAPCRDMTALVSRALDERLTFSQRVAVRSHLLYCRACRRFRKQTQQLHDALRNQPAGEDPVATSGSQQLSPEARERIRQALTTD